MMNPVTLPLIQGGFGSKQGVGHIPKVSSLKKKQENFEDTIPTFNNQGYMLTHLHKISEAFVEFSSHASGPVLDIGTAYGFVALQALKMGADVIANDMDPHHLDVLKKSVHKKDLKRISFSLGHIPGEVKFKANSLGAVLASGVLHYLSPRDFIIAIQDIALWLKPGGKFFFATPSPYTNLYEKFFPIFKKNQEIRVEWPGYIDDISKILPDFFNNFSKKIHLLDQELTKDTLEKNGFEIEKVEFFNINLTTSFSKEETNIIGVIARKL